MEKDVEAKLINVIKILSDKITKDVKSEDALCYTQAALNAAHVAVVLKNKYRLR